MARPKSSLFAKRVRPPRRKAPESDEKTKSPIIPATPATPATPGRPTVPATPATPATPPDKDKDKKKARSATKHDEVKPEHHLVPTSYIEAAARALSYGVRKYGRDNHRLGFKYSRLFNAAERHLRAWWEGEDEDPESGLSHLDHLAACLAMLTSHVHEGHGEDDRTFVAPKRHV